MTEKLNKIVTLALNAIFSYFSGVLTEDITKRKAVMVNMLLGIENISDTIEEYTSKFRLYNLSLIHNSQTRTMKSDGPHYKCLGTYDGTPLYLLQVRKEYLCQISSF